MSEIRIPVLFLKERPIPGTFYTDTIAEFHLFHNYVVDYQVEMYWPPQDRMVNVGLRSSALCPGDTLHIDMTGGLGYFGSNGDSIKHAL